MMHPDIWLTQEEINAARERIAYDDRIFYFGVRHRKYMSGFTRKRTVGFTTLYASHYSGLGLPVPTNAKTVPLDDIMAYLTSADGVRDTVNRLGFWPLSV